MSHPVADEQVDIAHLVATAVQQQALSDDPLPSPEDIERARLAAAGGAHSTCSAAVGGAKQPVRGLGGAGLSAKRKAGGSKAGSTISAATAPPMLAEGRGRGGAAAGATRGSGGSGRSGLSNSSSNRDNNSNNSKGATAAAPPAAAAAAAAKAPAAAGSGGSTRSAPASRAFGGKDAAGVRSFRTSVSPEVHDDGSDGAWESASTDEVSGMLLGAARGGQVPPGGAAQAGRRRRVRACARG
jgi:hypothetical protein